MVSGREMGESPSCSFALASDVPSRHCCHPPCLLRGSLMSLPDPLRVLRAVRFGTRFGFELEASLVEAASSEKVGGSCFVCERV